MAGKYIYKKLKYKYFFKEKVHQVQIHLNYYFLNKLVRKTPKKLKYIYIKNSQKLSIYKKQKGNFN